MILKVQAVNHFSSNRSYSGVTLKNPALEKN